MNIIQHLLSRINKRLTETKNPCKTYGSYEAADKAASKYAQQAADHFKAHINEEVQPCRYVVFLIPDLNRYTLALDFSELLARKTMTGGYLGIIEGIYKF